jgi:hypothetical protein
MVAYRGFRLAVCGLCLIVLVSGVCGCSHRNPQNRRAISGAVTLDGVPLKNGSISFQPEQRGGISSGAPIADGKYSIATDKGLPVGKYKVMIFAPVPGGGQPAAGALPGDPTGPAGELIPPEYNVKSDKFIEVTEKGPYEFKFEIVTKK